MSVQKWATVLLAILLSACTKQQSGEEGVAQQAERRSNFAELPAGPYDRVVSLTPNMTEMVASVGAQATLVGRTAFCTYPPEILTVPVVSEGVEPDVEALLQLAPKLIVSQKGIEGRLPLEDFRRAGIQVYVTKVETAEDVIRTIQELGILLGRAEEARTRASEIQQELSEIRPAGAADRTKRVLMIHGHRPLIGAGPGSWGNELIHLAGYQNVLGEGIQPYATLDAEWVVQLRPDVVVDTSFAYEEGDPDEFWAFLTRQGENAPQMVYWGEEEALRPGPRVGKAVKMLRERVEGSLR